MDSDYFRSEYNSLFKSESIKAEKIIRSRQCYLLDKFYFMSMALQELENFFTYTNFRLTQSPLYRQFTVLALKQKTSLIVKYIENITERINIHMNI